MMNIREYFEHLYNTTENIDDIIELEQEVYDMDDDEFELYCKSNDIDLTVVDDTTGELVVTLWAWDMCGE